MSQSFGTLIKNLTIRTVKSGFRGAVLFFVVGLILNGLLLAWSFSALRFHPVGGKVFFSSLGILSVVLIFPLIFMLLGKKRGMEQGMNAAISENKELFLALLFHYFLKKWPDCTVGLAKLGKWAESVGNKTAALKEFLVEQPVLLRKCVAPILVRSDFIMGLEKSRSVISSASSQPGTIDETVQFLAQQTGRNITMKFSAPSVFAPMLLVGINLALVLVLTAV
ncbi:hypothetical protein KKF84_04910 [Myxococcota bacterium]|nr:hypothetical protein [Myxococcota bacterium]MBU1534636.1 hypothetical protein [Myxococcota bacterium]